MAVNGFLVNDEVQKYNYESLENYNTPDFSSSSTYQVGDYVMYQGKLYKCTTEITTSGGWDSSKWSLAILSDDVANLRSSVESGEYGLSEPVKQAILQIASKVAYIDDQGQTYYDDLYDALYPLHVVSISATYAQSGTVYDTDTLDSLKADLVVTAVYSDSSTQTVPAADYSLSGTLTVGTSTITVSYGGKTTTFSVTVSRYIPSGYVTNGLVFFLDGKNKVNSDSWTDLVGDKVFSLTNCTPNQNGVAFDGSSSYGEFAGAITNDCYNETIEVVFSASNIRQIHNRSVLYQPKINGNLGISLYLGYKAEQTPRFALFTDANTHTIYNMRLTQASNKIGGNADFVVVNDSTVTANDTTWYWVNETGNTYLGALKKTSGDNFESMFDGTIHAIRIYNRKLTQEEIRANQQRDAVYYGV